MYRIFLLYILLALCIALWVICFVHFACLVYCIMGNCQTVVIYIIFLS